MNADKLTTILNSLHQDEISQFLTGQAQNLEIANARHPVPQNQVQQGEPQNNLQNNL